MRSLSHKEYGELRNLYESVYAPKEELTEEILDEVFNELVDELIEEGYDEEEAIYIIESATDEYIEEAKVTFGHDTNTRNFYGAPVGAKRRLARQKAGAALRGAVNTAKSKAAGAAAAANLAVGTAAHGAQRAATKASHAVADAPGKARAAASDAKKKAKSGIKGFIRRQAEKVVKRMSEEIEALEASGLFTEQELGAIMEAEMIDENRAAMGRINREFHRKKEAEAMAARARDPKVKRDLPKRKNDNPMYDPKSAGSSRVSGFKFTPTEDVEYVGEGLTGERYKAALKKGKQYSRRVSEDPAKRATRGGRGGESDFGAGDRGTGNRAARRAGTYQEEEYVDEALTGERIKKAIKKPGGTAYTRKVSADPAKRATRGGRGGESDFGAGDRGTGNKSRRRRGLPVGDED
jgi:hypothetical protein